MTIPYSAGWFYSTVEDLYRCDQVLYTEQLVSHELLHLMFNPQAKIPTTGLSYGYGWIVGEMKNHRAASHGGGLEGFAAEIRRYIDDKITTIILSNRETMLELSVIKSPKSFLENTKRYPAPLTRTV